MRSPEGPYTDSLASEIRTSRHGCRYEEEEPAMNTHHYNLPVRVLLCREDGDFQAHALEVDLVGCGKSESQAIQDLRDTLEAQISFASQTNRPELVYHPAPKDYFDRWEKAQKAALTGLAYPDKPLKMEVKAISITLSHQEIAAARRRKFHRASDTALAKAS